MSQVFLLSKSGKVYIKGARNLIPWILAMWDLGILRAFMEFHFRGFTLKIRIGSTTQDKDRFYNSTIELIWTNLDKKIKLEILENLKSPLVPIKFE